MICKGDAQFAQHFIDQLTLVGSKENYVAVNCASSFGNSFKLVLAKELGDRTLNLAVLIGQIG